MTQSPSNDDTLESANQEALKRLFEQSSEVTSQLLRSVAEDIGHKLLPEEGKVVYQYTSSTGLMGMVRSNQLWTTSIGYLNDAMEYELVHN